MSLTVIAENTTTTNGSEQILVTDTTGGTYLFKVDTTAMQGGDEVEVRIKTIVRSGGTAGVYQYAVYRSAQSQPIKTSLPCPEDVSISVTLKRTAGSDRAYPWKLLHLAS